MSNPAPGGPDQRESRRGPWLRCGGHGGGAGRKVFLEPVTGNNPADTRGRLSLTKRSVTSMGARGSPRNGRPYWRLWDALSSDGPATAKGRVGWRKNITPVGDRAAGDGETFPEVYSGLAAAGVTPWSCTPGIPTRIWQSSAAGKSSPDA